MSEPVAPGRTARRRKSLPWLIVSYATLIGAGAFLVAIVVAFIMTAGERSYTGAATVVDAHWTKICTVKVTFPDGSKYGYSFDTSKAHCASLTPGTVLTIDHGTVTNAPATEAP